MIHLVRPYRCSGWCCFCCLQTMEVQSPPGTNIGYIKQDFSFIYPCFSIQNADGDTILRIKGPCFTCQWCEVEFQVKDVHSCGVLVILSVCLLLFSLALVVYVFSFLPPYFRSDLCFSFLVCRSYRLTELKRLARSPSSGLVSSKSTLQMPTTLESSVSVFCNEL